MRFRIATVAVALTLTLVASCGIGGSDPTTSLILPEKAATGAKVKAEGIYSEAKAGLEVTLKAKASPETLGTTTTDKDGRYAFTFIPTEDGPQQFTVTVIDGEETIASKARALTILSKTGISAKLSSDEEAKVGDDRALTGTVEPAGEVRELVLESSPDAQAWATTDITGKTDASGAFTLSLDTKTVGERYYRAKVMESDSRAEATSTEMYLGVFDYKEAGEYYLGCVAEINAKVGEYADLTGDLSVFKGSAGRMSERRTTQANCFRDYIWPPSVAEDTEMIASMDDLDADVWNQMSNADTMEEYDDLSYGLSEDSGPATRVRSVLGLPKRD